MAVEVKQLVVKGTVLADQVQTPEPEPPPVCGPEGVDEEEIQTQSRRLWREEQRQREER